MKFLSCLPYFNLFHFYRATLCVNAVFAVALCPPVCLSVTLVHCIQTAEDIVKLLSRPGSPNILVFWPPAPILNSKGNRFSRGTKYKRWEHFTIFDWNCGLSRKLYEIGPWLLWNINRKSYALYQMVTFSMTLTDHNPVFKVTTFLKSNISEVVRLRDKVEH